MDEQTAQKILAAYPNRKMKVADAEKVVVAWASSQWPRDRWGNFKPTDTRRIKLTKRQLRREEKREGSWRSMRSTPMVEAALNLVKKAAETVGDESALAKIGAAKTKRAATAGKRAEKAKADALHKEVMDMVAKVASAEMPVEFAELHDTGRTTPEFQTHYNELVRRIQALRRLGKPPRDQDLFSTFYPPIAPMLLDVSAEWVEEIRDTPYTITVRPGGDNQAVIEIGTTAGEMSLGTRVDPVTRSMSSEMDVGREGDAYLSGRIQRDGNGAYGALFFIISQSKQRGAGSRVLDLWCNLMDSYGAKAWVAEGIGDEGMAFLNAKIRDKRLEKIGGRGANLVMRCLGGPQGKQPMLPGVEPNPKIVGDVQAYAAANPADIVAFPERPNRITIGSRTYAVSDIGVPIMSTFDAGDETEEGARVIDAGGNPFRYIWIYEPRSDRFEMYRFSDGEWKVLGERSDYPATFDRLRVKGQLNEVSPEELVEFEQDMRRRNEEKLTSLQEWWEEDKSDEQRQIDALVQRYFDERVLREAQRGFADVDRGVYPFDFEYRKERPDSRERQAKIHTLNSVLARHGFFQPYNSKVERFVLRQMGKRDNEELEDIQAIQWATSDMGYGLYDKLARR